MKLFQESEDGKDDRKVVKSQMEKRRRARMNRSLERLRFMLLQEAQQGGTQRRVEKTEILEHTVLFLQKTARGEPRTRAGGGGGGQKHSFQDGFSTCLQRAAQFLGPDGRRLCLGTALDASRAAAAAAAHRRSPTSGSLPHTRSLLRMLRQKTSGVNTSPHHHHPYQQAVTRGAPTTPPPQQHQQHQQPQRQSPPELRGERRASKQSPTQRRPMGQTLWRPWP